MTDKSTILTAININSPIKMNYRSGQKYKGTLSREDTLYTENYKQD